MCVFEIVIIFQAKAKESIHRWQEIGMTDVNGATKSAHPSTRRNILGRPTIDGVSMALLC